MSLIPAPHRSRFARLLALAALVFACGSQAMEAGHFHVAEQSQVDCLLCHSGAADTTLETTDTPAIASSRVAAWSSITCNAINCTHSQPPARGPPATP